MNPYDVRTLHTVSYGRVTLVDDTGTIQKLQISERPGPSLEPSLTDAVPHVMHYGFTSSPPIGTEVMKVRLWGNRTLPVALGTNHQPSRPTKLEPGEVALYDIRGAMVALTAEGITIDGAGLPLTIKNVGGEINAPTAVINCKDAVTASGVSLANHFHGLTGGPKTTGPLPE